MQTLNNLQNETFIQHILSKINDRRTYSSDFYGAASYLNKHGTSHISIIGPNGDAVALTSTINC
jgi:gamma-glutamyltranspeptidase/glutathione hydrolase/leukotriene-C4 hydrolase